MRHFTKRIVSGVAVLSVASMVLAACTTGETPTPTKSVPSPTATRAAPTATPQPTVAPTPTTPKGPQGTLNVALGDVGTQTWVRRLHTGVEDAIVWNYAETLIGANSEPRALEPRLATSWSVQQVGGKWEWDFKLRQGVQFHNGNGEMTAEDWKFTFADALKPDARLGSEFAASLDNNMNNFQVVSPYEFKLVGSKLNVATALNLSVLQATVVALPKKYIETVGEAAYGKQPIGTGPFVFREFLAGDHVTLEAVPNHWRKTPNVQTLKLRLVPEPATRVAMLRTGQADLAPLTAPFKREVQSAGIGIKQIKGQASAYVTLGGMYYDLPDKNCTSCPWVGYTDNARKVREALNISIDRTGLINKLMNGEATAAAAPFVWTPGPFAFNRSTWKVPEFNPTSAKQLLTEAGYPNGFPIKMALFVNAGLPEQVDIGIAVAGFWKDVGIKVDMEQTEFSPSWRAKMTDRTTGGYAWVLNANFQDEPIRNMTNLFNKSGGLAYLHDPKIDEYVAAAAGEPEVAKRMALAQNLGDYMIAQTLGIPLFAANGVWGQTSKVKDWPNIAARPYFNNAEYITLNSLG